MVRWRHRLVRRMRFLPAFLIRRFATPSPRGKGRYVLLPVIWGAVGESALGRCASIGPYVSEEARTFPANRLTARIPHPSLPIHYSLLPITSNSPRGKGRQLGLPGIPNGGYFRCLFFILLRKGRGFNWLCCTIFAFGFLCAEYITKTGEESAFFFGAGFGKMRYI